MVVGGDFRVDARLREGGMGQVWVAEQLSIGRKRALKVMRRELLNDEGFASASSRGANQGDDRQRSRRRGRRRRASTTSSGVPWLAMELLDGWAISEANDRRAPDRCRWAEVAGDRAGSSDTRWLRRMRVGRGASAISSRRTSSSRGRDRPAARRSTVKVLDFGLAKGLVEGALADSRAVGRSSARRSTWRGADRRPRSPRRRRSTSGRWGSSPIRALTGQLLLGARRAHPAHRRSRR